MGSRASGEMTLSALNSVRGSSAQASRLERGRTLEFRVFDDDELVGDGIEHFTLSLPLVNNLSISLAPNCPPPAPTHLEILRLGLRRFLALLHELLLLLCAARLGAMSLLVESALDCWYLRKS